MPTIEKDENENTDSNSLLSFLSDGASMLVRSSLLQVSQRTANVGMLTSKVAFVQSMLDCTPHRAVKTGDLHHARCQPQTVSQSESACIQATFFIALAAASRMGTTALAAHQIVAQLWLLTSYVTDGFAVAGTVLGSRLAHHQHGSPSNADMRYCDWLILHALLVLCWCAQHRHS